MFSNVVFELLCMWVESYLNLIHLLILNWRRDCINWVIQDPNEPTLLFTKPLDPAKLSAAGIIPPGSPTPNGLPAHTFSFRGRMGRGGRIVFDRWNPLSHTPMDCGDTLYVPPKARHSAHQWHDQHFMSLFLNPLESCICCMIFAWMMLKMEGEILNQW